MKFEYKVDHIRKSDEDFAGLQSFKKKKKSLRADGVKGPSGFSKFFLPTVFDVDNSCDTFLGYFGTVLTQIQSTVCIVFGFLLFFSFLSSFSLHFTISPHLQRLPQLVQVSQSLRIRKVKARIVPGSSRPSDCTEQKIRFGTREMFSAIPTVQRTRRISVQKLPGEGRESFSLFLLSVYLFSVFCILYNLMHFN